MRSLWYAMAVHLWQTTLVLAALAGLDRLVREGPHQLRDLLWSAGLLKLLLPVPVIATVWPGAITTWRAAEGESSIGPALTGLGRVARPAILSAPPPDAASTTDAWLFAALTFAWAAGVAMLMAAWLVGVRRSARLASRVDGALIEMPAKLRAAARDVDVPLPCIRMTGVPIMPSVCRPLRTVVVVPRSVVDALSREELGGLLLHENAHRKRGDLLRAAARDIAARCFFFYPPAWWLARRLRHSAELACDEAAVAAGIDRETYARALAKTVRLGLLPASTGVVSGGRSSFLGERFARLASARRCSLMFRHRLLATSVFLLVFAVSFVSVSQAGRSAPQEQDFGALAGSGLSISLSYQSTQVTRVLEDIAEQAGFALVVEGVAPVLDITILVNNTSVREVLELLSRNRGVVLTVIDASRLGVRFVGPRATRGPFRVGDEIREPEKVRHVNPEYPEEARRARLEGIVILQVIVDREGNVDRVDVLRGIGLGLDVAAEEAVKQWKYTPTLYDGRPIEVVLTVTVQFELIG